MKHPQSNARNGRKLSINKTDNEYTLRDTSVTLGLYT